MIDISKSEKPEKDESMSSLSEMDALSDEFYDAMHKQLEGRVSKKRLRHIEGVCDTAVYLAQVYGLDASAARLAGLLHDWDKGMDDDQIRVRVCELGIEGEIGEWVLNNMPEVIHGISAASALARQFPNIPDDVIHAIKVHTTACLNMSDLDKVIYVADAIEPGRNFDGLENLQSMIGKLKLDELYFEVYKFWTDSLIMRARPLHPETIRIWNDCCLKRLRGAKKRAKAKNVQGVKTRDNMA